MPREEFCCIAPLSNDPDVSAPMAITLQASY